MGSAPGPQILWKFGIFKVPVEFNNKARKKNLLLREKFYFFEYYPLKTFALKIDGKKENSR